MLESNFDKVDHSTCIVIVSFLFLVQVAFLIYRPVIRLFKPYKGSNVAWPADTSKALSQSSSKEENGPSKTASELVLDLGPHRKIVK